MDSTRYSLDIQQLIEEHQASLRLADTQTISVLEKLKEKALALGDKELLGYVYHSCAFADYFISSNYPGFLENIRLATDTLLACKDQSDLIHVYYLIAIDALNKGLYDLSYHNFSKAYSFALETGQKTSAAILEESMGHVLSTIGLYEESRMAFKSCLRGVIKDPSHPHYFNNVASAYLNEGYACLELGLINEAEQAYEQARLFMDEHPNEFQIDAQINIAMLNARLAVRQDDDERLAEACVSVIELTKHVTQLASYVSELNKLIQELIATKRLDDAACVLEVLSDKLSAQDTLHAQRIVSESKIAYYQAVDYKDKLLESYMEQDRLQAMIKAELTQSNQLAQDLIELANTLHVEQERLRQERDELISFAETDPLTGLANRYAADHKLAEAFEDAYVHGTLLGVGLLDLDNLKEVNDTQGHQAGDELLKSMAFGLGKIMDDERITCARYGGDEFIVICNDMSNHEIENALSKLLHLTDAPFSVGICNSVPHNKMKTWEFLQAADSELYKVKHAKKENGQPKDGPAVVNLSITSSIMRFSERIAAKNMGLV